MPTHKINADLDVLGEVQGTSLDINGAGDIAGNLAIDGTVTVDTDTGNQPFYITRSGATSQALSIKVMDDNVRFESIQDESADDYGGFDFRMDSGTTEPDFVVRKGTASPILTVRGDGATTFSGSITATSGTFSGNINANGNIVGDDGTNITNIASIGCDVLHADADSTTKFNMTSSSIDCLVEDTDVFQVSSSDFTFDPAVKVSIHKRNLAKTSNTDADADGDIVYFGSTTSMDAGKIYYFNSSGAWALADADAESTAKGMLAVALGSASDTNGMLIRGMVTLDTDPGTIGDTLFLSTTAGVATSTAPSGNGDIVRVIGYCLDSTNGQIYFNPDGTFVEVTA